MSRRPRVVFVCVRNAGKSQMAAGLMAALVGDAVQVSSAGTAAGTTLNDLSIRSLAEVGVDISGAHPEAVTDEMVRGADVVVLLGREARVEAVGGAHVERWITDEPSERGIEGMARMRLVRDDIAARVRALAVDLGVPARSPDEAPEGDLGLASRATPGGGEDHHRA